MSDRPLTATADQSDRWHVLAGVRFLLAVMVAGAHLAWFNQGRPLPWLERFGASAVIGFLVISGYSIGHSLHRRPSGFYRRRLLRIYPLYAAAVGFAMLPFLLGPDPLTAPTMSFNVPRPPVAVVLGNLFLLQNIACPPLTSDGVLWTLGVEVICYALAPWWRRWPTAAVLALAAGSMGLFVWYPWSGWPYFAALLHGWPLAMFAWPWLAGFLLHRHRASTATAVLVAVVGGVAVAVNDNLCSTLVFVATVAAIKLRLPVPAALRWPMDALGDLSYPVYLFHLPTYLLAASAMGVRSLPALVGLALAVSAAFLLLEAAGKRLLLRSSPKQVVPTAPAIVE